MNKNPLREVAREAWDALKALLEIHPTILEELSANYEYRGDHAWIDPFLDGFEIVQYQSMSAASKDLGITLTKVQRRLEKVQASYRYQTEPFAKWIRKNPELHGKVVRRFGLRVWPHVMWCFGTVGCAQGEDAESLLPFVAHPDVAEILANRFAELRGEIEKQRDNASDSYRRICLIDAVIHMQDSQALEELEGVVCPSEEVLRHRRLDGDAMEIRTEDISEFSIRTYNCLKKANKLTIRDLTNTSEDELMNIRNFGRRALVEVVNMLEHYGLALKTSSHHEHPEYYWDLSVPSPTGGVLALDDKDE